jgi:hypothetical protein
MSAPILDPTAGRTARDIALRPGFRRHVTDPTDPNCGGVASAPVAGAGSHARIPVVDPTDSRAGAAG